MKNEKFILLCLFAIFFVLSTSLVYLMITNDLKVKQEQQDKMNAPRPKETPEVWPKVEINVGK